METMQTSGEYTLSEHRVFESPVLGTGYRCELTDKFSLNTALQYQEVGENYYFRLDKLSGDLIKNEKWVRSDYQNLGLMVYPSLQFKIAKTNFHFYIGYEIDFNTVAHYERNTKFTDYQDPQTASEKIIYTNFSLDPYSYKSHGRLTHQAMAGLGFEFHNNFRFQMQFASGNYYNYYLEDPEYYWTYEPYNESHAFHKFNYSFTVGYEF